MIDNEVHDDAVYALKWSDRTYWEYGRTLMHWGLVMSGVKIRIGFLEVLMGHEQTDFNAPKKVVTRPDGSKYENRWSDRDVMKTLRVLLKEKYGKSFPKEYDRFFQDFGRICEVRGHIVHNMGDDIHRHNLWLRDTTKKPPLKEDVHKWLVKTAINRRRQIISLLRPLDELMNWVDKQEFKLNSDGKSY